MVVAGTSANRAGLSVVPVAAAGACGAAIGDSMSYLPGRTLGRWLIMRWKPVRDRVTPRMKRAESLVERRGGQAIFVARFIGPLRAVAPAVAGIERMPYRTFLPGPKRRELRGRLSARLALQFGLVHLGAALDVLLAGLVAELVPGAPPGPRWERSPPRRHDEMSSVEVLLGSLASPARARFFVDRPCRDLFGGVLVPALVLQALFDGREVVGVG
ncbi:MAG: DedA family protein [Acidimicrobiia bacterium]